MWLKSFLQVSRMSSNYITPDLRDEGDSSMTMVPPLSQYSSNYRLHTPENPENNVMLHSIQIIAQNTSLDLFQVNFTIEILHLTI